MERGLASLQFEGACSLLGVSKRSRDLSMGGWRKSGGAHWDDALASQRWSLLGVANSERE